MTPSSSPSPVAYRDPFGDAHQVEGQRVGNQIGALFRKSYLVQKRQSVQSAMGQSSPG
jgi:hypothetical protein